MKFVAQSGDLEKLSSRRWRLDNLYYIMDKDGNKLKFKMNWAQSYFLDEIHTRNVILKARQLGFSTFIELLIIDACLFNTNTKAVIIDKTLDDAESKLKEKVLFAYDNLPKAFQEAIPIVIRNARSIELKNGSRIEVGTSARGGTIQWEHISELGAVAARTPYKAREIKSGAFNAVPKNGFIAIESTAEGKEGVFYDICEAAMAHVGDHGPLDFKFHFFPWWMDSEYQLEQPVAIPTRLQEYFVKLSAEGINLTERQKWWYVQMEKTQKEDMKREYPSFPEEAFEASMEGTYFSRYMAEANEQGRINSFPYNPLYPVHTFWDIGRRDNTAIWFVQFIGGWIYVIDHYETSGQQIKHFATLIHSKPYKYGQHWFPHDIRAETWGMESTRIEQLLKLGIEPDIVPNLSNQDQIESAYDTFPRCRFNEPATEHGRKCLRMFRKEWDPDLGVWKKDYLHDWTADTAKAFLYMSVVYKHEDAKIEQPKPPLTVPSLATESYDQVLMIEKDTTWNDKRI